jgi:hypothetical protein
MLWMYLVTNEKSPFQYIQRPTHQSGRHWCSKSFRLLNSCKACMHAVTRLVLPETQHSCARAPTMDRLRAVRGGLYCTRKRTHAHKHAHMRTHTPACTRTRSGMEATGRLQRLGYRNDCMLTSQADLTRVPIQMMQATNPLRRQHIGCICSPNKMSGLPQCIKRHVDVLHIVPASNASSHPP